jgi:hypothetical protein
VRQALSRLSYSPSSEWTGAVPSSQLSGPWIRGQGVEPRSPRSERGVLPVRRSRNGRAVTAHPSMSRTPWEIDAAGERHPVGPGSSCSVSSARKPDDVFHATRLPFDPGSPAADCADAAAVAVLRGGALEPELRRCFRKSAG